MKQRWNLHLKSKLYSVYSCIMVFNIMWYILFTNVYYMCKVYWMVCGVQFAACRTQTNRQ